MNQTTKQVSWNDKLAQSIRSGLGLSVLLAAAVFGTASSSVGAVDVGALTAAPALNAAAGHIQASHVPAAVSNGQALRLNSLASEQHLSLALNLPVRNQPQLDQLLKDLQDPQSPNFHKYLTSEQFTEYFGPTQADYDAVIAWAKAKGLNVTSTTPNRRLINVDGAVSAINRAFNITLNEYQHPSEDRTFFSTDSEPTAAGLSVPLLQVGGLSNYSLPHPKLKRANAPVANLTGSGPSGEYLPSDMRAAYYGSGSLTGAGQSIGIFSFDGYLTSDVSLYYSSTGTSHTVPINNVLVNGYSGACVSFNSNGTINTKTCDDGEQILDIVNAIGMAPGATQILFYEGDPASSTTDTNVLNKMATDNIAKSIGCSWGWGANAAADDAIFQQMAAQGQTFLNATGDNGAFSGSTNYEYPSVSQYIIQVGGTDLTTTGPGGAWSSETGWTDSGGGYESGTPIPSWQQIAGVINSSNKGSTTLRNSPDVSMEANFDNPTVSNGQFLTGYGGTSFAAPRWAGFVALINQQAAANGNASVGFFNPTLYNLGVGSTYTTNFHDITSGTNQGTNSSGGNISGAIFSSVTGYDLVTGWGSPKAAFITTLAGGSGSGGSADFSLAASPTTLSVAQGANTTDSISVTDLNGFTGSVALSASGLPTGVTATFSPASTTSSSILTLTASSSATTGAKAITITGTSGSLTHTATVTLTVTAAGGGGGGSTQLITNGGFETGAATPWTLSSGILCSNSTCSGETAHSGTWFAWLDGYGKTHTDIASQTVVIPGGKTTATLAFYLHIDTAETGTTAKDTLTVQVLSSSGTVLATLATYSNVNAASGYVPHSFNLASYIGQTVTIKFTGAENSSKATSFVLDDVTLTVQ